MYICICNAITEKQLQENSFLLEVIGNKCGKCIEEEEIDDKERMTYLTTSNKKPSLGGLFTF